MKKRTTRLRLFTPSGWEFYCDSLYEFTAGTVLHVNGTLWMIVRNDSQWGAVSKENKHITLLRLERLIRAVGFGVAVCIPEDYDN